MYLTLIDLIYAYFSYVATTLFLIQSGNQDNSILNMIIIWSLLDILFSIVSYETEVWSCLLHIHSIENSSFRYVLFFGESGAGTLTFALDNEDDKACFRCDCTTDEDVVDLVRIRWDSFFILLTLQFVHLFFKFDMDRFDIPNMAMSRSLTLYKGIVGPFFSFSTNRITRNIICFKSSENSIPVGTVY